ncbi:MULTISPECIES: amino acid ABC transporter permease [Cupriavidus]|uniref:amino acid ABC transporter permease n=1 Tax=Cupriavidus TaxID=106589 RepID=UPI00036B9D91|nr:MULTISPECIES: amino acid ABC transporter permease [Cupriavidus]
MATADSSLPRAGIAWPAARRFSGLLWLLPLAALAVAASRHPDLARALAGAWQWSPALLRGFLVNIGVSVLAIALGTAGGLLVGALRLSPVALLARPAHWYVQVFRNAPWLVLIYFSTYVFPFEINIGRHILPFPDWFKVVVGLALPASANVAEVLRGAVQSIPLTQWEAASSMAFSRRQILRLIIVPQCVRRMLPPWMNLYATLTMGTALASLVGVHDLLDTAQIASNTVNQTAFTVLIYFVVMAMFFAWCYPISRFTRYLEQKHAVA